MSVWGSGLPRQTPNRDKTAAPFTPSESTAYTCDLNAHCKEGSHFMSLLLPPSCSSSRPPEGPLAGCSQAGVSEAERVCEGLLFWRRL